MLDKRMMMDELVNKIAFDETRKLLVDLAIHLSKETKIQVVPERTISWVVENYDTNNGNLTRIIIPLIHFFGMYVGYNSELDMLVIWDY